MNEVFIFIETDWKTKKTVLGAWKEAKKIYKKYFDLENKYKIVTVNDFDRYCQMIDEVRAKWGVTKHKAGKIFLFNPLKWKKGETGHVPEDAVSSLVHEMFHVYCFRNKPKMPLWLEEGVATYLSQDFDGGQKDIDFVKLKKRYGEIPDLPNLGKNFSSHVDHAWSYLSAYMFVKYLAKKKGMRFVKKMPTKYKKNNRSFINNIGYRWKEFVKEQHE